VITYLYRIRHRPFFSSLLGMQEEVEESGIAVHFHLVGKGRPTERGPVLATETIERALHDIQALRRR